MGHAEGSMDRVKRILMCHGHREGRMDRAILRRRAPRQDLPDLMVAPLVVVESTQ